MARHTSTNSSSVKVPRPAFTANRSRRTLPGVYPSEGLIRSNDGDSGPPPLPWSKREAIGNPDSAHRPFCSSHRSSTSCTVSVTTCPDRRFNPSDCEANLRTGFAFAHNLPVASARSVLAMRYARLYPSCLPRFARLQAFCFSRMDALFSAYRFLLYSRAHALQ